VPSAIEALPRHRSCRLSHVNLPNTGSRVRFDAMSPPRLYLSVPMQTAYYVGKDQTMSKLTKEQPQLGAVDAVSRHTPFPPNQAMLDALRKIEEIQQGMQPRQYENADDRVREARSGGMYGIGADE